MPSERITTETDLYGLMLTCARKEFPKHDPNDLAHTIYLKWKQGKYKPLVLPMDTNLVYSMVCWRMRSETRPSYLEAKTESLDQEIGTDDIGPIYLGQTIPVGVHLPGWYNDSFPEEKGGKPRCFSELARKNMSNAHKGKPHPHRG